ncbi:MAG: serine hydrolase domain-containing protein [Puia sp.]
MKNLKSLFIIGLHLFAASTINAQLVPTDNKMKSPLDSLVGQSVRPFMENPVERGLSIGIYRKGEVFFYNYGVTGKQRGQLPDADTYYAIASISKTFAGALLAQAVLEKKMNLDDDIRKYLVGVFPNLQYEGHPIRMKDLVTHRSGIPFLLPDISRFFGDTAKTNADIARLIYQSVPREEFYRELHGVKLDTLPGTRFRYSNSAVILLGYILENIYGIPYETLLREKILGPLDMKDTKIILSPADMLRYANAYDDKGNTLPEITDALQAAAGIKSTTRDMLRYIRWNIAEKSALVRMTHQRIWGEETSTYYVGLNWQILTSGPYRVIWQEGNLRGFNSNCVNFPELDMGIVVLTNESDRGSSARISAMINRMMKSLDSRAVQLPQ